MWPTSARIAFGFVGRNTVARHSDLVSSDFARIACLKIVDRQIF
jgi:hypothetical protein